jgi:predicted Zn-dependent protease
MEKIILKIKTKYLIFVVFIGLLGLTGCENATDVNFFSVQDDVELGKGLDQEIKLNPQEYPIYDSYQHTQYVQEILNEIIESPEINYADVFEYKITLIDNDDVVNAFAAPGGYIYVYTGLLKFLDNEATLAGIIAHEVAHAERRHATQRMTKAYGISIMLGLILGENPSMWEELAANLFSGLTLLYNSREDEYEADEYSFRYLKSTKWYPGAILYFFYKADDNREAGFLEELFLTHPLPSNRIEQMEALVAAGNVPDPSESNLFADRYAQFKATLK